MSWLNATAVRKLGAMPSADETSVDDDEWAGFSLMLGHLMQVALAVFVPSIALIAYLYHA